MELIQKNQQKTAVWSGGKTTELYIFPKTSSYQNRNFKFRISSASVETEESDFTHLPSFHRVLMVLEGDLLINHQHQYIKHLKQFETDSFDGSWKTTAKGMVKDFNLMMSESCSGNLQALHMSTQEKKALENNCNFLGIYVYEGDVNVDCSLWQKNLKQGDFLILDKQDSKKLIITSKIESNLIISRVNELE